MASTTAPSTPTTFLSSPALRRSFTSPPSLTDIRRSNAAGNKLAEQVDTLFVHESGRIVKFSPPLPASSRPRATSRSSAAQATEDEPAGTLPWASHTERTIAAGLLSVYRVKGSVAFLSSGSSLHAILPKSQCWCVDGETKFVLRIRGDLYWRIELPNAGDQDRQNADHLKEALKQVLLYERTPCPFKRGFTVDLPDLPKTPTKKRPWRPKNLQNSSGARLSESMSDGSVTPGSDSGSLERSDEDHSDGGSMARSDGELPEQLSDVASCTALETEDTDFTDLDLLKTPTRPIGLSSGRAVTAPPELILRATQSLNTFTDASKPTEKDVETASIASSIDSFHSFHSFHSPISPLPPSPPYSDPPSPPQPTVKDLGINVPRTRQHRRDLSELTVTAESFEMSEDMETPRWLEPEGPSTPIELQPLGSINDTAAKSASASLKFVTPSTSSALRKRPNRRRDFSPLPSPANLYSPRTRMTGHHLTTAILRKTCSFLLGPPVQLVALMLNIAARITNSRLFDQHPSHGEGGRAIPGTWDYNDAEDGDRAKDLWEEDDYGISLSNLSASRARDEREIGGSWDID